MTRTTIKVNGETVFDAFHNEDADYPVRIVGNNTTIETSSWVDVYVEGDSNNDEPWYTEVSAELNGDVVFEDTFDLISKIDIDIGGTEIETYDLTSIEVQGGLVE